MDYIYKRISLGTIFKFFFYEKIKSNKFFLTDFYIFYESSIIIFLK